MDEEKGGGDRVKAGRHTWQAGKHRHESFMVQAREKAGYMLMQQMRRWHKAAAWGNRR